VPEQGVARTGGVPEQGVCPNRGCARSVIALTTKICITPVIFSHQNKVRTCLIGCIVYTVKVYTFAFEPFDSYERLFKYRVNQWQRYCSLSFSQTLVTCGTERGTTKEHEMWSMDICSMYRLDRMLFGSTSSRFQLRLWIYLNNKKHFISYAFSWSFRIWVPIYAKSALISRK